MQRNPTNPDNQNNPTQSPVTPQYQMGATSNEAEMHAQIAKSPIPGPGAIVQRLGQQFQLPRAGTDSEISRDLHGID
jgi:hypothetical protein